MLKSKRSRQLIFNEKYHDNCHDYLKRIYIEKYAVRKYIPLLYDIKKHIPKLDICQDTPYGMYTEVIVCDQHAVVFTHHNDIFPILGTYALNACVGLVMYIPSCGAAALAHIDGLPGYSMQSAIDDGLRINFDPVDENIAIMLNYLTKYCTNDKPTVIDYYLVGGIFHLSEVMVHDIIGAIAKLDDGVNYRFNFLGRNILGPENQSRNICIDSRNGNITYFDYTTNSEVYQNQRNSKGLAANIIKAPRRLEAYLDVTYVAS